VHELVGNCAQKDSGAEGHDQPDDASCQRNAKRDDSTDDERRAPDGAPQERFAHDVATLHPYESVSCEIDWRTRAHDRGFAIGRTRGQPSAVDPNRETTVTKTRAGVARIRMRASWYRPSAGATRFASRSA
jgi:hypothetical protein